MDYILYVLVGLSLLILCFILIKISSLNKVNLEQAIRQLIQEEFKENRKELAIGLRENRAELNQSIAQFQQLFWEGINNTAKANRDDLTQSLKEFQTVFTQNVTALNDLQKQKFDAMAIQQDQLVKATENKLEKMRETVDEKLHKTLEQRLGQSFKIVSDRLEAVQKGLGEMQHLANGVGDLKKVLSNVKTRGILGEIQLGNILEQIMAPEQYEANVKTKQGSNDHVEYAIKLPGKEKQGDEVYLPVDAKFPQESYLRLQDAFDRGDVIGIEQATKALVVSIKRFAKEIHDKYIDPPHTTDFGILFLPIEGLFAEVVRQPDLVAVLQRDYKIIITGPTTLAALLNSMQMGFKTLAIQKRSSEVWQVLGAVKNEFGKFGGVLEKAQKKINDANKDLDALVGTRTRMMLSKLKNVEELPSNDAQDLIDGD